MPQHSNAFAVIDDLITVDVTELLTPVLLDMIKDIHTALCHGIQLGSRATPAAPRRDTTAAIIDLTSRIEPFLRRAHLAEPGGPPYAVVTPLPQLMLVKLTGTQQLPPAGNSEFFKLNDSKVQPVHGKPQEQDSACQENLSDLESEFPVRKSTT